MDWRLNVSLLCKRAKELDFAKREVTYLQRIIQLTIQFCTPFQEDCAMEARFKANVTVGQSPSLSLTA